MPTWGRIQIRAVRGAPSVRLWGKTARRSRPCPDEVTDFYAVFVGADAGAHDSETDCGDDEANTDESPLIDGGDSGACVAAGDDGGHEDVYAHDDDDGEGGHYFQTLGRYFQFPRLGGGCGGVGSHKALDVVHSRFAFLHGVLVCREYCSREVGGCGNGSGLHP